MPLILVTQLHLSVAAAGLFTTAAVAANVLGNIMAGVLLRAGVPIWANVAMSFTVYGIVSLVIFASGVGGGVIAMTAAITLGIGGLSPGSIFAGVPRFAPNPRRASSPQADATGTRDCQSSPIMTRLAGRLYSGGPHSSSRLPCRAASRVES
jgi:hypothetical protein